MRRSGIVLSASPRRANMTPEASHRFAPPLASTRDVLYYRPNADCVIQVRDVLFKVHRALLEREQDSMFTAMFELSSADNTSGTDEVPLQLDDNPEEFRALCWALYAMPLEIQKQESNSIEIDLSRMLALTKISNKYAFTSLEQWSTNIILRVCSTDAGRETYFSRCSATTLCHILSTSILCNIDILYALVETYMISRVENGKLSVSEVLDLCESHGWRGLEAKLYYREVIKLARINPSPDNLSVAMPPKLAGIHVNRLLWGFWSLTQLWAHICSLRDRLTASECDAKYLHREYCTPMSRKLWDELLLKTEGRPAVDVLGKLSIMKHEAKLTMYWPGIQNTCQEHIMSIIEGLEKKLEANMDIYFLNH